MVLRNLQVNAKPSGSLTICGFLYKFRYYATGISQSSWKKRFFTLHGSVLSYYLTERDTEHHPRGIMDLQVLTSFPPPSREKPVSEKRFRRDRRPDMRGSSCSQGSTVAYGLWKGSYSW